MALVRRLLDRGGRMLRTARDLRAEPARAHAAPPPAAARAPEPARPTPAAPSKPVLVTNVPTEPKIAAPVANKAEPAQAKAAPPPATAGGFAAAARAAATSGISTAATFRHTAEREDEEHEAEADAEYNGTNDPVIGSVPYDGVIRAAADGAAYAGPVDNESARAKAAGERLDIDRDECIGCGTCVEHIDTVFWLNDEEGKAYVLAQEGAMDCIQDAIDACPVTCISWQPGEAT